MKSLRYLLTCRPHNTDDCLHLATRRQPLGVAVELGTHQWATDQTVLVEFIAQYVWRFEDLTARCREICGSEFLFSDLSTRHRRLEQANEHLQRSLQRIAAARIPIHGPIRLFEGP
jgi:hypothetical protein